MRTVFGWAIAIAAAINIARAQTGPAAASADPVRTYSLLREDEDWSFLKDPTVGNDPWDRFKFIPVGSASLCGSKASALPPGLCRRVARCETSEPKDYPA